MTVAPRLSFQYFGEGRPGCRIRLRLLYYHACLTNHLLQPVPRRVSFSAQVLAKTHAVQNLQVPKQRDALTPLAQNWFSQAPTELPPHEELADESLVLLPLVLADSSLALVGSNSEQQPLAEELVDESSALTLLLAAASAEQVAA